MTIAISLWLGDCVKDFVEFGFRMGGMLSLIASLSLTGFTNKAVGVVLLTLTLYTTTTVLIIHLGLAYSRLGLIVISYIISTTTYTN